MSLDQDQLLQHLLNVVGIRAPITAVAVLQLIAELHRIKILDDAAVGRIKEAVARAAFQVLPSHSHKSAFEAEIRQELDRLFDEIETYEL